jgi:steroid delta-isomerase-like uncharacterized protein
MSEANETALREAVAAFNDPASRDRYLDLYAPDVVLHGYPSAVDGRDGARSFYSELWHAFPDARVKLEETIASDDRVAARYTLTGIQAQDVHGAPLSNPAAKIEGMTWLHFRDGQVVEVWQASDTPNMLARLSARTTETPTRHSASADAAALRWEETHLEP